MQIFFQISISDCGELPKNIVDKMSALISIGKDKGNLIYVSSASKAVNYAIQLSEMNITQNDVVNSEREKSSKSLSNKKSIKNII